MSGNDPGGFSFAVLRLSEGFSGHCNFEFDMCSWRQSKEDDFDWLIKAGSTPTPGTGPSNDHTLRDPSGHYLYLEGSFPQAAGETARITGPVFSRRSSQCKVSRPFTLVEFFFSQIQNNYMIAASLVNTRGVHSSLIHLLVI